MLRVNLQTEGKCDDSSNDARIPANFKLFTREDKFFAETIVNQRQNVHHYGSNHRQTQ